MAYEEILTTSSNLKEAKLTWGGANWAGNFGPLDAALVKSLGANRTAFIKPAGVTIEYSRDGGSTWTDYGATDAQKIILFTKPWDSIFVIGKLTSTETATDQYQFRVTLDTKDGSLYTELKKFVIYVSTNYSNNCWLTIKGKTHGNVISNTDTWVTFIDKVKIQGWGGYNVINPTSGITTYGNTDYQYQKIQFIFGADTASTKVGSSLQIKGIQCFGGMGWSTPSTMAATNDIYSYDENQNVTFPGAVTASNFNGKATSLRDSNNGNTTTVAYSKAGLTSSEYSCLAAWNGYELRAVNKSQFSNAPVRSTKSSFPSTGDNNTLYIDTSTKKMYIWI